MAKKRRTRKDGGKQVRIVENGGKSGSLIQSAAPPVPTASTFDPETYRAHVDHFDMDADAKVALLRAVWLIMQSFVDRAFGDDPAQHVRGHVDRLTVRDETAASPVVDFGTEKIPDMPDDLAACFARQAGIPGDSEES